MALEEVKWKCTKGWRMRIQWFIYDAEDTFTAYAWSLTIGSPALIGTFPRAYRALAQHLWRSSCAAKDLLSAKYT